MVRDDGSPCATLVLIGEAPGTHEMAHGRPFVGPSGGRLEVWWRRFGLNRSHFYITNVLNYKPDNIEKVPREEMEAAIAALHERLAKLEGPDGVGPVVIVPTGNYALYALTGKGKVSWHRKDGRYERPGILDWRGSILAYEKGPWGRPVKVIPTIHPAAVLRQPGLERWGLRDWQRISEEIEDYSLNLPQRTHAIKPSIEEVELFCADLCEARAPVSVDIETPKGRVTEYQMVDGTWQTGVKKVDIAQVQRYKGGKKKGQLKSRTRPGVAYIGCIGFANTTDYSLTIPLTLDYWKSRDRLDRAKAAVASVLADPEVPLVMQNGMFDSTWLRREGYTIAGWLWDTRAMHHCLDPRDDHDLASMASHLTRQPFWKHEAKDPEEIEKYAANSEALWTYNGIDVCVTLELFERMRAILESEGLLEFYLQHYGTMMEPLLDMAMHGIEVDRERMVRERTALDERAGLLAEEIAKTAGMPLVARKGLSNDRLKFLFYGAKGFEGARGTATFAKLQAAYPDVQSLGLPPVRKKNTKGDKSITVDEVTIRKLVLRFPAKLGVLGPKLLEYRRNRKLAEFLDCDALDVDGRMRCLYSFITEAGRLASHGTPWGTGRNLQNIDRELRYVFIPDKEN